MSDRTLPMIKQCPHCGGSGKLPIDRRLISTEDFLNRLLL